MTRIPAVTLVLALLLAGCGDGAAPAGATTTLPVRTTVTLVPDDATEPTPVDPPPAEAEPVDVPAAIRPWVDAARADLTARGIVDVAVIAAEFMVWPDASLGCPQPGMAYAQVQTEGYRIRLEAAGKTYDYHGGSGRGPFLCERR